MQTIRSFVAIPLADDVRRGTVRLIERLRSPDDGIRWVPTDNLHLTLKFLGEVDNVEIPSICERLRGICQEYGPFELQFGGTGGFPNLDRPRVLYAGVEDSSSQLQRLVGEVESQFADLGFKPEPRDYRPHLTLGRTRSGSRRARPEVIERIRSQQHVQLGRMQVESVQIVASFLDKMGPTYQVMDTIRLPWRNEGKSTH